MMVRHTISCLFAIVILIALAPEPATSAQPGNAENGATIYAKRCILCHGEEGDGDSPAAERLNPPPRDFTLGQYKFKTTAFDQDYADDGDLFRMIRDGMPGTAMPGWADILSEQDMWDLIAHIKTFAGIEEEEPGKQLDYGSQIASSAESIAKGEKLFHQDDRCSECHGVLGKGDAIKKLKDDNGARTWPRNLTKPWTFRVSNGPKDIFARISTGIPGTQMPSFADPKSKKILTPEERWHVANYVASLAGTKDVVRAENTVIKARKISPKVPEAPDDPLWDEAEPVTFALLPQIIAKQRFFTPSNDTITVRAIYNDTELALLLTWDDRSRSLPGDAKAAEISDPELTQDKVAVQLPVQIPDGMEKPYFGMGDAGHPVNLWHWQSGAAGQGDSITLLNARGFEDISKRDAGSVGLSATGSYGKGTWRVVMKRGLAAGKPADDIQFLDGKFIPIAFAAWDGSNSEAGSKHTMTTWYWLLLEPATGSQPLIAAFLVLLLAAAGQFWWVRSAASKQSSEDQRSGK